MENEAGGRIFAPENSRNLIFCGTSYNFANLRRNLMMIIIFIDIY
jgi:hypothetical protein